MAYQDVDDRGWVDDPTRAESFAKSCRMSLESDHTLAKFFLSLRYARPNSDYVPRTNTSALDGFLSVVRQIGYNQLLEVTDACTARICQPLQPKVVPVAAKPDIARMCTLLNRLQSGVLDYCEFLAEATTAWEDSYCCPCGFVMFWIEPETREIRCRRVDPLHVYWLRGEGRNPMHLAMDDYVAPEELAAQYPDYESEIMATKSEHPLQIQGVDPPSSLSARTLKVVRVWRRKTGDAPGKVVISLNKRVLNGDGEGEDWNYDFFPFAVFRNRWDNTGFGGIPVARYVAPHHLAINNLARIAEESLKGAIPVLLSHKESGVNETTNVPWHVRKWQGTHKPELLTQNPVSEQVLRRIDYHDAKSYALAGINKALAAGQAPKGVVAGVAMREIIQLADARAAEYEKHWERGWREAGHIIVAFANELKKVRVRSEDANAELMKEIDTTSIRLEKNDYRISYALASALSKGLGGLLQDLSDVKDLGFIDTVDMARAVGNKIPDLQANIDGITAPKRLAEKQVQDALEKGEISVPPSVMQGKDGLDAIIILGKRAWCNAMISPDMYPAENLEALRRLMRAAQAKQAPPQPAQPTIQPAQPMSPNSVVGVGTPNPAAATGGGVATNQYEAMSMGLIPPTNPQP